MAFINGNEFFFGARLSQSKVPIKQTTGDSDTSVMSQKAVTEKLMLLERDIYSVKKDFNWYSGGLLSADGYDSIDLRRIRTDFIINKDLSITVPDGVKFGVFFYNKNGKYISSTGFQTGTIRTMNGQPTETVFIKLLLGYNDDRNIDDINNAINGISIYAREEKELAISWVISAIDANGNVIENNSRITSAEMLEMQSLYLVPEDDAKFLVAFYDKASAFIKRTNFSTAPTLLENIAPVNAVYFKVVIANNGDSAIDLSYQTSFHMYLPATSEYINAFFEENKSNIEAFGKVISDIERNKTAIEETKSTIVTLGNSIFCENVDPKFEIGGLQISTDGWTNDLANRARTGFLDNVNIKISADNTVKIGLCFYNEKEKYLGGLVMTDIYPIFAINHAPAGAKKIRIVSAYVNNENISNIEDITARIEIKTLAIGTSAESKEFESDIPENIGVLNAILNFKQLIEVQYTLQANMPHIVTGYFMSGKTIKGLPYTSTRKECLFVPNNVSLHTFLTAVKNPNSYLYKEDDVASNNGITYYGAVCSTAVAYSLGILPNYSTHQWTQIPDMEIIENQSAYGLKLCDTIVGNGHVVMVTDITRNKRGKIGHITISEAINPVVKSTNYTPDELETAYPTSAYKYCRYKKLYTAKHTQSPFVAVEDETPQTVTYNTAIITRKGDKSNWLSSQDVVIDVLEAENYTQVQIYKDDILLETKDIASVITLSGLTAGSYKARLTDGTNHSDWCYWIVVDAVSEATAVGENGQVNVRFSASNATPIWIQWANGTGNGTEHISLLSEQEIASGSTICSHQAGSFKVRVAFKTDYGIIHSELPNAITVL